MSIRRTEIDSLAAKLDALVLTSAERAALDTLFEMAAGAGIDREDAAEVEGFAVGGSPASKDSFANQEVSYFLPKLLTVFGRYIGETEKNL